MISYKIYNFLKVSEGMMFLLAGVSRARDQSPNKRMAIQDRDERKFLHPQGSEYLEFLTKILEVLQLLKIIEV